MKNLALLLVIVVMYSCSNENKYGAKITFTEPISLKSNFLFSTCGGQMFIMADSKSAQMINDAMYKEKSFSMYELGVGNAFIVDSSGTYFLYTAKHCAVGLEKYTRNIGADIAIINYAKLRSSKYPAIDLNEGYKVDYNFNNYDSVFVRGYLSDKKGKVHFVTISGVGHKKNIADFDEEKSVNFKYLQENTLSIPLKKNVDLAGLSGSPAFNKFGKVIGVYSGRQYAMDTDVYYARVSLFK